VLAALDGVAAVWQPKSAPSPAYFFAAKTRLAFDNSAVDNHTLLYKEGSLVMAVGLGFEVAEVEIGLGSEGTMTADSVYAEVAEV
jgi:hypothetical protein